MPVVDQESLHYIPPLVLTCNIFYCIYDNKLLDLNRDQSNTDLNIQYDRLLYLVVSGCTESSNSTVSCGFLNSSALEFILHDFGLGAEYGSRASPSLSKGKTSQRANKAFVVLICESNVVSCSDLPPPPRLTAR